MILSSLRYLSVFTLPILAIISFRSSGWITFLPLIEAFFLIPLLELFFSPDPNNVTEAEEKLRLKNPVYDFLVYLVVPIHFYALWLFLNSVHPELDTVTLVGRITSMGMLCGVLGINVAHELGHRTKKYEQWMAKALLLTSLYMHFFIEHNRGHHRNVSTQEDPSSARYGEPLYLFWLRSVSQAYMSAWKIESDRLKKKGLSSFSLRNEMLQFQLIQIILLIGIYYYFGLQVMTFFLLAAVMGFLLLETVNYIEHYGLRRNKNENGRYERVMPTHSWNSDHIMGRMLLFELSRHSDHHYIASRKYQILRHMDESPQMPTGYPGMMLLASIPPLWFKVMNKKVNAIVRNC